MNQASAAESPRRLLELDGLRGIAILLVIPHNTDRFGDFHGWIWPFAMIAQMGWIGVQLFFVLSGFLITRNLLASHDAANYYRAFFGRRALRIFPIYFLTLIFFLVLLPMWVSLPPAITASYSHQIWLWTFLANWVQPFGATVYWFPHFWSLCVEEQFYLIWPFVIAMVASRKLVPVCIGVIAVAFVLRIALAIAKAPLDTLYMFTVCRMDALAFGCLAAIAVHRGRVPRLLSGETARPIVAALIVLLLTALITQIYNAKNIVSMTLGYTVLASMFAIIVVACTAREIRTRARHWLRAVLTSAPLRSVGRYSYGMYVFHLPISLGAGSIFVRMIGADSALYPILYTITVGAVTYSAAYVSYHLIEKHFLAMKR